MESRKLSSKKESNQFKTIEVKREIPIEIDEGNLLAVDIVPINLEKSKLEEELAKRCRDNTQLLLNKIWELPIERVDTSVVANLPDGTTIIPREKPVPKPKPETKWEKYAKVKGIQKRKKSRMVWDEKAKDWKPRWGYERANDEQDDWVLEVPENADPMEDQFEKRAKAKKERVAKNELQRLRNLARANKGKVPGVGLTPTDKPDKDYLSKAISVAKKSTASLGKHDKKLPNEKEGRRAKRKFESNLENLESEKKRALDVITKIGKNKPIINTSKATNISIRDEQLAKSAEKKSKKTPKKNKSADGKNRNKKKFGKKK